MPLSFSRSTLAIALCTAALSLTGCYSDPSGRIVFGSRPAAKQGPTPDQVRDSRLAQLESQNAQLRQELDSFSTSLNSVSGRTDDAVRSADARGADTVALRQELAALTKRVADVESQLNRMPNVISAAVQQEHSSTLSEVKALVADSEKRSEAKARELSRAAARSAAGSSARASSGSSSRGPSSTGKFYEHTVEAGQTVSEIAKAYSVTPAEIIRENGLKDASRIRIGQTLYIPAR